MKSEHDTFMERALAEGGVARRLGNSPIGSVIVRAGTVVGIGHNAVLSTGDPTAHAEIQAIRDACRRLETIRLTDCICYTVMEPCPMCCWALAEVQIDSVVLGARHSGMKKFPVPQRTDYGDYSLEKLLTMTGRQFKIVAGVLTHECEQNRRSWSPPQAVAYPR
jgi:tRNA(Arg) A34 adenosine deaminase TadA